MKNEVRDVDLAVMCSICETLKTVAAQSMGPGADMTLLTSVTGQVSSTSEGFCILQSLHIDHPVAKFLLQSLTKLNAYCCDGSKTFLLCVAEALRLITKFMHRDYTSGQVSSSCDRAKAERSFLVRLSRSLQVLLQDLIPQLIREVSNVSHVIRVYDHDGIISMAKNVVNTSLSCYLNEKQYQMHSPFFHSIIDDILAQTNFLQIIDTTIFNFDLLHIKVPNLSSGGSQLIAPYIIQQDFSFFSPFSDCRPVQFIICQCKIDGSGVNDEPSETFKLVSQNQMSKILQHRTNCLELFLKQCSLHGVQLILSTQPIPQFTHGYLEQYGISAIGNLLQEDGDFLQMILGKTSIFDIEDEICSSNVAVAKSCASIIIGGHQYVHLNITGYTERIKSQFLVCDLTEGLCSQMARKLFRMLKSIRLCFNDSEGSLNTVRKKYSGCNAHKTDSKSSSLDEISDDDIELFPGEITGFHQDDASECKHLINDTVTTPYQEISLEKCMHVIQAGGVFEILASNFFMKASEGFNSCDKTLCCQIIGKCLLAVPKALHQNASKHYSEVSRYIMVEHQILQALREGTILGINKKGAASSMELEGLFEPMAAKVATLCTVIQTLEQLLRLEVIINIHR